jgi:hypothetical protein
MKRPIGSLFVVAFAAAPAVADGPRKLRSGSPACGNVMSERMQQRKTPEPRPKQQAEQAEQAEQAGSRALATALAAFERTERLRPRVLPTGSPACGNVVKAETGPYDRAGACTPEETVLALELRSRFKGRWPTRAELDVAKQARAAKWSILVRSAPTSDG